MNISDIIKVTNVTAKAKKNLQRITVHKPLCSLLMFYHDEILKLIPENGMQIDSEKLSQLIFSTFSKLPIHLATINDQAISDNTLELLDSIWSLHTKAFDIYGEDFQKKSIKIMTQYCAKHLTEKGELICLFLDKINEGRSTNNVAGVISKDSNILFLCWHGGDVALIKLGSLSKKTGWFVQHITWKNFFNNKKGTAVIYCSPKTLVYISRFIQAMKHNNKIYVNIGKAYLEVAAKMIYCNGKRVTAKRLHSENSPSSYSPEENLIIDAEVSAFYKEVFGCEPNKKDPNPMTQIPNSKTQVSNSKSQIPNSKTQVSNSKGGR